MDIIWAKNNGLFHYLETVDVSTIHVVGVYIIWQSPSGLVIYVGQGNVGERIPAHRIDPQILRHRGSGALIVAWADVGPDNMNGVERYLADALKPLVERRHPDAPAIPVDLPA